ncbi:MAG: DUF2027 domain-containing protein [Tannerella sp.]|jgi:hypothetical protein|nr:DUF2027 domain-containing protein [Tannerella sp.]
MIKTGDKVRFLNSVGGGIVKAFRDKQMVLVEDESGFDFPVFISECVVVNEAPPSAARSSQLPKETTPVVKQTVSPKPPEDVIAKETSEGERLSVYLAYLPVDPKALTQSGYEAYFINESNYYLYFNYMNRTNNSWTSRYQGLVEPNTKIFMEDFQKEDLNSLERVCIQLIAFKKNKPFALKNVVSVELRLDTVKFYKIHCFLENDFFEEDALIIPVIRADVPEKPILVSAMELQEALLRQKQDADRPSSPEPSKPKKTELPTIEIDLHIHQLLDQTQGLSASDMLNYQLDKFHEAMKEYAGEKGRKIVFIHGKGEGILRKAIEKELKNRYKSCQYQDASFLEYGFGATLVKIR